MTWWQFEPERKYPYAPAEASDAGDVRFPLGFLLLFAGLAGIVIAIGGLLFRAPTLAVWSVSIGLGCIALAWLVMPGRSRK